MSSDEKLLEVLSDPILWIENFITIINKNNEEIPFVLNHQQQDFMDNISKYNMILKSRQLGFSTLSCALSLYHAMTKRNTQCLLVSYTQASSDTLFYKLKSMYQSIPDIIKPKLTNNNKKELVMENGSIITCAVAGTKDLARGSTLTFVHLSEYAFWGKNASNLLLGIEQALIPKGTLIIESTANGFNHFEELYSNADKGEGFYKTFFFGWHKDKQMFADDYETAVKIWEARHDNKMLIKEDLDQYELNLYKDGASLEQLVWRRLKISSLGMDGEIKFRQEYPSNAMEAFAVTGICLFNKEGLILARQEIENEIDIRSIQNIPKDLKIFNNTILKIFQTPEPRVKYYIGVDSAEGVGADASVIQVLNAEGEQCLEFGSNKITPHNFADIVYSIASWYNNGLLVIERRNTGASIIERLRSNYSYLNIYKQNMKVIEGAQGKKKLGFLTTPKTKSIIINDYREWFDTASLQLNSKILLDEMGTYILDSNGSMNAQRGKHDDRLIAMALALHGIKYGTWYASSGN